MNDHADKAREIIATYVHVLVCDVKNDVHLVADYGMDSIEFIDLRMALENEFKVEIPEDDFNSCATVANVLALLDRLGVKMTDHTDNLPPWLPPLPRADVLLNFGKKAFTTSLVFTIQREAFEAGRRAALSATAPDESVCPACEGKPEASNSPCAVCGATAKQDTQVGRDDASVAASSWLAKLERLRAWTPEDVGSVWEDQYAELVKSVEDVADALTSAAQAPALPDDLLSHRASWRAALVQCLNAAPHPTVDIDDRRYWAHELEVFDRVFAELGARSFSTRAAAQVGQDDTKDALDKIVETLERNLPCTGVELRALYEHLAGTPHYKVVRRIVAALARPAQAAEQTHCPHCTDAPVMRETLFCPCCGGTLVSRDQVKRNAQVAGPVAEVTCTVENFGRRTPELFWHVESLPAGTKLYRAQPAQPAAQQTDAETQEPTGREMQAFCNNVRDALRRFDVGTYDFRALIDAVTRAIRATQVPQKAVQQADVEALREECKRLVQDVANEAGGSPLAFRSVAELNLVIDRLATLVQQSKDRI